jgi:hypothetical protein
VDNHDPSIQKTFINTATPIPSDKWSEFRGINTHSKWLPCQNSPHLFVLLLLVTHYPQAKNIPLTIAPVIVTNHFLLTVPLLFPQLFISLHTISPTYPRPFPASTYHSSFSLTSTLEHLPRSVNLTVNFPSSADTLNVASSRILLITLNRIGYPTILAVVNFILLELPDGSDFDAGIPISAANLHTTNSH